MVTLFENGSYWFCAVSLNRVGTAIACNIKPTKVWVMERNYYYNIYTKPSYKSQNELNFQISGRKTSWLSIRSTRDYYLAGGAENSSYKSEVSYYLANTLEDCKKLYNRQLDSCIHRIQDLIGDFASRRKYYNLNNKYKRSGINLEDIDYNKIIKINKVDYEPTAYYLVNYIPILSKGLGKFFTADPYACMGGQKCFRIKTSRPNNIIRLRSADYPYKDLLINYCKDNCKSLQKRYLLDDPSDYENYLFGDKLSALNAFRKKFNEGFDKMLIELKSLESELFNMKYGS